MPAHILIVEPNPAYVALVNMYRLRTGLPPLDAEEAADHMRWRIECPTPQRCDGWTECAEDHDTSGDEFDPDEDEVRTFHGVEHTFRYAAGGWTVPYPGCVVAATLFAVDLPDDLPRPLRPGRWAVDDDWHNGGTELYLTVIRELETTP